MTTYLTILKEITTVVIIIRTQAKKKQPILLNIKIEKIADALSILRKILIKFSEESSGTIRFRRIP